MVSALATLVATAALVALLALPLSGMWFAAMVATVVAALMVYVWAQMRRAAHAGSGGGGGGHVGHGAGHDDGAQFYPSSAFIGNSFDSAPDGGASGRDDEQRSCRFDSGSDSGSGFSDSGNSGSDSGSGSSDCGGSSSSD